MKQLFYFLNNNKKRAVWFAIIWTALILFACFLPGNEVPNVRIPFIDKWVHFLIFAGFSFLWLCVYHKANAQTYLMIFGASVLLGYLVELIQGSSLTSGRAYDNNDVIADAVGGFLGIVVFHFFKKKYLI